MNASETIFFGFLILIAIILIYIALSLQSDLKKCEQEESPFCPEYLCKEADTDKNTNCGFYAYRTFQSKKICSGGNPPGGNS